MARTSRVKPTQYPVVSFHALRSAQLVSSIIVAGIMSYFLWQLEHDHYGLPWTFILLLTVSLLTILSLSATIVLHCLTGLNPLLNIALNGVLLVLWTVGFALLTWWSSGTLGHVCNKLNWDSEMGIGICRTFKALFAFALLGFLSTLLALLLDIRTNRSSTRRGVYNQMQTLDNKGGFNASEHVLEIEGESNPNPNAAKNSRPRAGDGYAMPEQQFTYEGEDTGYQGASGAVNRRSLEARI